MGELSRLLSKGRLSLLLIATAALVVLATAANVTIIDTNAADYGGALLKPYYENLNAPLTGCTAPCLTVDTQTTEPNPSSGTLSLDGSATGTWSSGSSFTVTLTTGKTNDVVVLWVVTYSSGTSITVSSVSDSLAGVTWQSSARKSYIACTGTQETTQTEWYGVAAAALTSDVVTLHLSGTPTAASGEEFAVSGANIGSPFDPNSAVPATATACSATAAAPTVSGVSTTNVNDFVFALFGGYTSKTETAGAIAGTTATLMKTVAGTGDSLATEYRVVSAAESSQSCAFGTTTTYWGILCDALVQASGSFTLPAGSSMYLWSPQFASAASIPASTLSLQLFADPPAPALESSDHGSWTSGSSFTISGFSTTHANDLVLLSVQTYLSGASVSVSSVSDSLGKVTWQTSARASVPTCSGTQESTLTEWYGVAPATVTSDTITVTLSGTPTAAQGVAIVVSGADTTTPFDPASGLPKSATACSATGAAPTVSSVSTAADTDLMLALYGGYTSTTETAGAIGGATATLIAANSGTGDSEAAEYRAVSASQSGVSCAFGTSTTYWAALCDAVMPARQTITVSYYTTNSAGTVQSTMISGATATATAVYQPISIASSAGSVPASGYVEVVITAPSGTALTINWGYPKLTNFQVTYTYRS